MKNGHAHHYHLDESTFIFREGQWGGNMGPHPLGPKEIEGLLRLYATDWRSDYYWLTSQVWACPEKVVSSQTIHTYRPLWLIWVVIFEVLFGCHDILILGKSPIKWRRHDVTIAVYWV